MLRKLLPHRAIIGRTALVASAALLAVTLATSLSGEALANGKATPTSTRSRAAPVKASPFVKKPAIAGVININTATATQLQKLPGIGPSKARRIVQYRAKRGPFRRIRDLRRVKGIGRKTLQRMGKHLSVKGPTTAK